MNKEKTFWQALFDNFYFFVTYFLVTAGTWLMSTLVMYNWCGVEVKQSVDHGGVIAMVVSIAWVMATVSRETKEKE